jgi:hypothetical protein
MGYPPPQSLGLEAGYACAGSGPEVALTSCQEGQMKRLNDESGRVGYLIMYLMGVPIGLLLLMWVILGNNIFGPG